MPPGVPTDRVAAMSTAMMETFRDQDFLAEADKRGLGVNSPRTGKELHDLLTQVYTKTPPHIIERLRKISTP
jgi:tripartite-type tricarboxylate transporter receptor subunit TctC